VVLALLAEMYRPDALILLSEGVGVYPLTTADEAALTGYLAAGGLIDEHPDVVRTVVGRAWTSRAVLELSRPFDGTGGPGDRWTRALGPPDPMSDVLACRWPMMPPLITPAQA